MIRKQSARVTSRTALPAALVAAWMLLASNARVSAAQTGGDAPRSAQPTAATPHEPSDPAPTTPPGQPPAPGVDAGAAVLAEPEQGNASGESEKALDTEAFPFLRRGIVIGAGIGVHALSGFGISLKDAATTPMAYLGYMFNYWSSKYEETNAFCASFQTKAGLARADAVAIVKTAAAKAEEAEARGDLALKAKAEALAKKKPGDIFNPEQRGWIEDVRNWKVGVRARCGKSRRFGVFIGLPGKFSAEVAPRSGGASAVSEVTPLATAGIIGSPRPYLQVLLGLTIANVAQTASSGDPEMSRTTHGRMYSFFFGVGTTLDAIGKLFK